MKWDEGVTLPKTGKIYLYLSKRKWQLPKLWLALLSGKRLFGF